MTIVLELPAALEAALLAEAQAQGRDASSVAVELLAASFATEPTYYSSESVPLEESEWWLSLTPEEKQAEIAFIRQRLAEIDAGKTKPAEEVYARIRAKYAHLAPGQSSAA